MVAALELYVDLSAERRLRAVWDALEDEQIPSLREHTHRHHRPHLSLVVADALDPTAVKSALDDLTGAPALTLSLQYVGQFIGRVLFLGPAPSTPLLAHQAEVWRRLSDAGIPLSPLYAPGQWVPHTTLSMRVPRPMLSVAIQRSLEVLPIEATLTAAAVVDHVRGINSPLA